MPVHLNSQGSFHLGKVGGEANLDQDHNTKGGVQSFPHAMVLIKLPLLVSIFNWKIVIRIVLLFQEIYTRLTHIH